MLKCLQWNADGESLHFGNSYTHGQVKPSDWFRSAAIWWEIVTIIKMFLLWSGEKPPLDQQRASQPGCRLNRNKNNKLVRYIHQTLSNNHIVANFFLARNPYIHGAVTFCFVLITCIKKVQQEADKEHAEHLRRERAALIIHASSQGAEHFS